MDDRSIDIAEHFNAAVAALEGGADAAAAQHLDRVLASSPHDGEAILMRAQIERAAGDLAAAAARLEVWLRGVGGDDLDARVELADVELERGDPGAAAAWLREVLERRPHHGEALLLLGDAFAEVAAWTEAARAYRACVSVDPFCREAWYNLGRAHAERGDAERAVVAFEGYLDAAPEAEDREAVLAELARLRAAPSP